MPGPDDVVTMIGPDGQPHAIPTDQVAAVSRQGFHVEGTGEHQDRITQEAHDSYYGGALGQTAAGIAAVNRGFSFGLSDLATRGIYGEGGANALTRLKEANPTTSTVGEIAGALATAIPTGGASLEGLPAAHVARLGAKIATTKEGAGVATKLFRGALGGSAEGGVYGLGSGVSDLSLDTTTPLSVEHSLSVLSSHALYGAGIGAGAGTLAKGVELGLAKTRGALDAAVATREAEAKLAPDLSDMVARGDVKAVGQYEAAAKAELKAAHETNLAEIETQRVSVRKEIADETASLRRDIGKADIRSILKGVKLDAEGELLGSAELATLSKKSTNQLARALDNPIKLGEDPTKALDALQRQDHALTSLMKREPELRAAVDATGARGTALDAVPGILERNRSLQQKIADVTAPLPKAPATSAKLDAAAQARDVIATKAAQPKSVGERILGGVSYGAGAGLLSGIPFVGHILGPLAGAKVSQFVTDKVFGRLAKAGSEVTARQAKAIGAFLDTSGKAVKHAVPISTRVLSSVRYAPERPAAKGVPVSKRGTTLADVYKQRSDEIKSQTAYDLTGVPRMRPEARQAMAGALQGIRVADPVMADRMETLAAARIEFLASKLPRRPDIGGMQIGPDNWRPSDMAMRTFARYAAAAEDPHGVIERLATGAVTPEDAETMRAVYPEMMADVTRQIVEGLPQLQKTLPYHRRLALSIFSGVPVDPAMDPRILSVLQSQFAAETGSAGGTMAPRAQPAFGSVSKPKATPAQERGAG